MLKDTSKTDNKIERRVIAVVDAEFRVEKDDAGQPTKLLGSATKFNSDSVDMGGWIERIRPGAFTNALKTSDVRALVNHNPDNLLGRSKSGTLQLEERGDGLYYVVDPLPQSQLAKDTVEKIERRDMTGNSFSFITLTDEWHLEDGQEVREIVEVKELFDVGPVTYPAYPDTSASVRWNAAAVESRSRWLESREAPMPDPASEPEPEPALADPDPAKEPIDAARQNQVDRAYRKAGRIIERNKVREVD